MQHRSRGQSIVEMAFVLPILLLLFFGIIDLGYYLYGYATVYQSARNGAETASALPPYPSKISPLDASDPCVATILSSIREDAPLFPDLADAAHVSINYPATRALKEPIEINITYQIEPLTPLWKFVLFANEGRMTVSTTARRSIEALGNNPNAVNLVACTQ